MMPQVIKGTDDVEAALVGAGVGPVTPPPTVEAPPGSEPPSRHEGSPAAAAAPSGLRLPAIIEACGRRVRVALGAAEGWGRDSSSLIALPHGMEVHTCVATLSPHTASRDAPQPKMAGGTGRPALEEGAPTATALLFLILKPGKVLRFQARL